MKTEIMKTSAVISACKNRMGSFLISFLLLSLLWGPTARGQQRIGVTIRPGISFTTTKVYNADINWGWGFEGSMSYRVLPHIAAYAGWGWNTFSADESFAGNDVDMEETGYALGFRFVHSLGHELPFDYFLRGALIISHLEIENREGDIVAESGYGAGFQVEVGLSFAVGERWYLIPGIKYQTLSREIAFEGLRYPVDLNFLSVGVNVCRSF